MLPALLRRWFRPARCGLLCSATLHVSLLVLGVAQWLGLLLSIDSPVAPSSRQVTIIAAPMVQPTVAEVVLKQVALSRDTQADPQAIDSDAVLAGMVDPRWQELVEATPDETHAGSFVSVELMQIMADAERRSPDDNLERLAELSNRLNSVSSEQGVSDINSQLRRVLGAEARAERPAEEVIEGPFDFATAQLHDVLRMDNGQGGFVYTAILVDSAGRKFESPMVASEGETAYRTMQLVKSNPLLEKVYRGVVMSMLDKVLNAAK